MEALYSLCIHKGYKAGWIVMPLQTGLSKGAANVYEQLRHQILHGDIVPGAVLQQVELAQQLGVSRTPVRHALQQLAHDGLVEFLPGQTARVVATSLQDAIEMRQVRMWLEVPGLLLALRRHPYPAELLQILDQVEALGDNATPQACEQLVALDEQFHRWVLRECGNTTLARIVGGLLDLLYTTKSFNIQQDYQPVRANLRSLRAAIQGDDIRRVRQLMIEHMTDIGALTIEPIGFEDAASES
jgi:DNA-binding GntR family transcriptional regulator